MKNLSEELKEVPFGSYVLTVIIFNFVVILFSLLSQKFLPPQIPLFFGTAEGTGWLAPNYLLALPNTIALGVLLVNVIISKKIEDDFLKKVLILGGISLTFFATITCVKIFFLIGSF